MGRWYVDQRGPTKPHNPEPSSSRTESMPDDEVEFVYETYRGKELVDLDDDDSSIISIPEPVFVRGGHFRMMDLPAELRVYIYQFLLPYNLVLSHARIDGPYARGVRRETRWQIAPKTKDGKSVPMLIGPQRSYYSIPLGQYEHWLRVETSLLLVNKEISNEARELKVAVRIAIMPRVPFHHRPTYMPSTPNKYMFGLESLATLRGIKDVRITGVADWYAQYLQLCIQGKGVEVLETDWPPVKVKRNMSRTTWTKKSKMAWITTRK
ncbi:hypothetical protein EK21DRAFT_107393 [Setomelanomma holmii]|uniref:Uncharacterized protein n=1 Tax=Setomelanomma holmii TaxID=210430 RepID=A0A9P4LRF7_9PLEO|nr:hypothetical protein EK21DRAFT_107393 [Setomelanomma holmii]